MSGTISASTGLASGTDWSELITAIIDAKKARTVDVLEEKVTAYEEELTAWQSFNTILLTLNNYIEDNDLDEDSGYELYSCTMKSSDTSVDPSDVLSAAIGDSASAGKYSIEVTQLAQAEKLSSDMFTSQSEQPLSTNGGGDITINGYTVSLSSDDTLTEIASKINDAAAGVTATILSSDSGYTLLLESDTEGADGISLTDDNNVLETLGILESGAKNTIREGKDASITIDGTFTVTSSSNTIEDCIEGVTLDLTGTNTGSTITLTIAQDDSTVSSTVSTLVDDINSVLSYISDQNSYDSDSSSDSDSSGTLKGDINLSMIRYTITSAIFASVSENSTYTTAALIGICFEDDGTLSIDSDTLTAALADNPTEVINVLKSISSTLNDKLNVYVDPYTGTIKTIEEGIQDSIDYANERIDALNERYDRETEMLEKKYTALELLISESNLTADWLTQQTAYMTGSND